jgi:N-acetylmuramate 1-kinase
VITPTRDTLIAFAREALGLSEALSLGVYPLAGRGSDRIYFRLSWDQAASAILVHYDPKRIENAYHADIATFLRDINVPVPNVFRHDPAACLILMEDLGETDLWSARNSPRKTRRFLYQKTLTIVQRLHTFPEKEFPSGRVRLMEGFGPDLYRWERDYFRDHFVKGVCHMELKPALEQEIERELAALADRLGGLRRSLVHRDLQSQNVMIREEEPFLIDFQGMRFGSLFYDLGSLLCDPYVEFSDEERDDLLSFYYGLYRQDLDWGSFRTCFWEASAQRLMQALGAYGFLGLKKGLKTYLEHIPAGLQNLLRAAAQVAALPRLLELSRACQKVTGQK